MCECALVNEHVVSAAVLPLIAIESLNILAEASILSTQSLAITVLP